LSLVLIYSSVDLILSENRWWVVLPIVASDSEASAADVEQEVTVPEVGFGRSVGRLIG